ncbi:hypothetical protein AOQ84DRAFT_399413 [Glonium stellatum]|uniref:Uncharacterized protein n=1 Tax=Glonium stellatum TaxID=574774 RepID=A0A8E2EVJ0_9PEZI|nr:hypothetical protein AOQ84DRAFT_399413 [Glonium stellatum]
MAAIIDVIGVVSGLLGILQFGMDNFGSQDTGGSVVRVKVGLDQDGGLSNAGGNVPDIRLFNEVGDFLGAHYDPGSITDGTDVDVTVSQTEEQQATYALFSANDNAVCIAYVSITWPDGQKYGWEGDWGKQCGATWYYSNVIIDGQKPACIWIDANGDQPVTGFQVHFPEFVTSDGSFPHDASYYCNNGPPFSLYYNPDPNTINYWVQQKSKRTPGMSGSVASHPRRSVLPRGPAASNDTRLVVSNDPSQPVSQLCEDGLSVGPDFVNLAEGQFCQMSTKTVYPVCSDTITDGCFNVAASALVVGGVTTRDAYSNVIDWSDGSS